MTGGPAGPAGGRLGGRLQDALRLVLVTDADQCARAGRTVLDTVAAAVAGGVTSVQLREKRVGVREQVEAAVALAAALPPGVPLLVDDRVDVALAARARGAGVAGVHLGQSDLEAGDARALLGPDAVIGLSAATAPALAAAAADPARVDYVGVGAFRATSTEPDAPPPLGRDRTAALLAACPLPAVVIGGVTADDAATLRRCGAAGVAVVSAVCAAPDPAAAAAELRAAWERADQEQDR